MALSNSATRYGSVAKTLHWLTALGIVAAIPLGILANDAAFATSDELATKALLFSLHKTLGVTIFAVALIRIAVAVTQTKPVPLHPERRAESLLAETVHWLLYGSLVLVPLTGWIHHSATTGFAPIWWPFGQSLPFVPKSILWADTSAALHVIFERVLFLSIVLHVAGALKHHFIDRDPTLRRMWFGSTQAGDAAARHAILAPLAAAIVLWGAAIGIGVAIGVFEREASAARIAALQEVDSDWQVQDGTLTISVQQMGATVTGSFADWTAEITFDNNSDAPGKTGEVNVTVAIGSLTLGSVTAQASGADFLAADRFPTATYTADINRVADGYEATGTLTLKGAEVPVTLPFQLTLAGDSAQMDGRMILDRRAFDVGANMTDPGQLGFDVVIEVSLTATRGE